jgi:hypothetical protein
MGPTTRPTTRPAEPANVLVPATRPTDPAKERSTNPGKAKVANDYAWSAGLEPLCKKRREGYSSTYVWIRGSGDLGCFGS